MIKWVLTVMLLIIGFPTFSDEFQHSLQDWQTEALLHLGYGNAHLLSHKPWQALEHFQKAMSLLDESDDSSCLIGFLITFSQVIAYDFLGFRDQCKQSIGSLFLAINAYDNGEDVLFENNEPMAEKNGGDKIAIQFLQALAILTPSPRLCTFLGSIFAIC
jgi:hypothetical protein